MAFEPLLSTIIIALYLVMTVAVGLVAWKIKPSSDIESFALADRAVGWFTGFFSIIATQNSALAMLGFAAFYYTYGLSALSAILVGGAFFAIAGVFRLIGPKIWKLGRETGHITPSDTLRDYYDSDIMGYITSFGLLVALVPYLSLQFTGLGIVISLGTGGLIPFSIGVIAIGAVIIIYTWLGGMKSVAWVDTMQGIFILIGTFGAGIVLITTVGEGPEIAINTLISQSPDFMNVPANSPPFNSWVAILTFSLLVMVGLGLAPHMWIRFHYFEDIKNVKYLPVIYPGLSWFIHIGVLLAVLVGVTAIPNAPPDQFIPLMFRRFFPTIIFAIIMSAILAAIMSSASSMCHVIGVMVTQDFVIPLRPNWSESRRLVIARSVMVISVVSSIALTLGDVFLIVESGAAAGSLIISIIGPQIIPIFASWRWVTKEGAIVGSLSGGVTALLFITQILPSPLGFYPGTFGFVVNIFAFALGSMVTSTKPAESTVSRWREIYRTPIAAFDPNK